MPRVENIKDAKVLIVEPAILDATLYKVGVELMGVRQVLVRTSLKDSADVLPDTDLAVIDNKFVPAGQIVAVQSTHNTALIALVDQDKGSKEVQELQRAGVAIIQTPINVPIFQQAVRDGLNRPVSE